jgi:Sortase and related acyltransferases
MRSKRTAANRGRHRRQREFRASIGLHKSLGFREVGVLRSVGFKFDRWVDSVLMQRALGAGDSTPP